VNVVSTTGYTLKQCDFLRFVLFLFDENGGTNPLAAKLGILNCNYNKNLFFWFSLS